MRRAVWVRKSVAVIGIGLLAGCLLMALALVGNPGGLTDEELVIQLGANAGLVLVIAWRVMLRIARDRA